VPQNVSVASPVPGPVGREGGAPLAIGEPELPRDPIDDPPAEGLAAAAGGAAMARVMAERGGDET
jgi:hypothetical protein